MRFLLSQRSFVKILGVMVVMKFGGTSVGSSNSIEEVTRIILAEKRNKVVVLSAFSGVTNLLVAINKKHGAQEVGILDLIFEVKRRCEEVVKPLFRSSFYLQSAVNFLDLKIHEIENLTSNVYSDETEKHVLAQGEIISTHIFQLYLQEQKIKSHLVSALSFMSLDRNQEPDLDAITNSVSNYINNSSNLYITQGFICRDYRGNVSNLQRGGSDYTASLIGAALDADEIQIWTDIDGMHNNDPRYVNDTFSVERVSFDEAAELAYFGAKILHPQSLIPAKNNDIPVILKNTFNPDHIGTTISNNITNKGVTSVAAKDGITAIKIKSYRMLLAYGFLKRVFEVFEKYKTPIDMITTSEVAVSLTIDNPQYLESIVNELQEFGSVEVDSDLSIICVAGDFSQNKEGQSAQVFSALKDIPIRMISYGGSNYNISLLVKKEHKVKALNSLNTCLFRNHSNVLV